MRTAVTLRIFSDGGDLPSAVRSLAEVVALLGQREPTACRISRYWKINTLHEIVLTFDPAVRADFGAILDSLADGWEVRDGQDEASALWAKEQGGTSLNNIKWMSADLYIPAE